MLKLGAKLLLLIFVQISENLVHGWCKGCVAVTACFLLFSGVSLVVN